MGFGGYLQGLILLGLVLGASGLGGLRLVGALAPELRGLPRALAVALLATALLIAVHLLPAALGVLGRASVAIASAGLILGALLLRRRPGATPPSGEAEGERFARASAISRALAALCVGGLALYMLALLARFYATPPTFIDTLTFHLPGIARWIQSGSIWQIDQFLPYQAHGYYPMNGNVVQLAAVLPWSSDFAIRFVNPPFFALAGLATFATARELGAPATSSAIASVAALSFPAATSYVVDAPTPDSVMYATLAIGVLFLVRHARTHARSDLLLAGLGLGIALGTRWYGVSCVAVLVAVWLATRLVSERRRTRVAADLGWLCLPIACAGSIWLVRNLIESGNPVFPVEVSLLGETVFSAPRDVAREIAGFRISDYLDDPDVLSEYVLPALETQLGFVAIALGVGCVVAAALALRERSDPLRGRVAALAVAALGVFCAYLVTPYSALGPEGQPVELGANVRYAVPALLLAAPALASGLARARRARPWLEAGLAIVALDAILRGVDVLPAHLAKALAALVAAGGLAVALVVGLRRGHRAIAVGAVAVGLALTAIALYLTEERSLERRYLGASPTLDAALARGPAEQRIGLAGAWPVTVISPVLPLFGPELRNEVAYVGELREGMLLSLAEREAFQDALLEGNYELLMVGRAIPVGGEAAPLARWATAAGYRTLAREQYFTLLARDAAGQGAGKG